MRLYIAVLDQVPDHMVPVLVAHSVLGAHMSFTEKMILPEFQRWEHPNYMDWLYNSFKKCVVRVNQKEFDKIAALNYTYLGHENTTLGGKKSCAIPVPVPNDQLPSVLKFARLWAPKDNYGTE